MIHDADVVVRRAVRMVRDHVVEAIDGSVVPVAIDTICVHGDTPGAADLAARIRDAMVDAGIDVKALRAP